MFRITRFWHRLKFWCIISLYGFGNLKTVKKNRDPIWNDEFQYMLEEPPTNDRIHVEVVSVSSRMGLLHPKVSTYSPHQFSSLSLLHNFFGGLKTLVVTELLREILSWSLIGHSQFCYKLIIPSMMLVWLTKRANMVA